MVQSLVEVVETAVPRGRIYAVAVEIGELTAVLPEALQFCFTLCTADTRLEGATLQVIDLPAVLRCRACGARVVRERARGDAGGGARLWTSACSCGGTELQVEQGEEVRLRHVEVARQEVL